MAFFMNHSKRKSTAPPSLQCARGVTLVEVMVAIVVLSIGLLGIAGLQAATLKYKINTWARSSASTLLSDLSERVRINPDSAGNRFAETGADIASKYVIGDAWAAQQSAALDPITPNCETEPCTPLQRATHDLQAWRQRVRNNLPQGAALISGNRKIGLTVTMMWFDKELVEPATDDGPQALVATPVCSGNETGMAQQTCCPSEADVPAGVRCARFSFIP
ncbi:type IV pilus modification protein PilV [Verminephrobacter eiseniae]|nr:type IV pilus modification protein PilV [Verminephrobacter eiseniae]KAB7613235.1 type IV pilus modification protein PilV [Verminephrobacter sp. Larva24]MCW5233323.1 type IV pilus modification protein PilV [Verminephrobacter eiseniae]MCW5295124.1 type IV pilus modification protein PilV [Verminephrobacter eiseniae]MCW8187161.1 type IV pilus modification protein PilV [Verminephrobacter eiseniae]MCW8225261.1 type IV pilus modification protein PilV [Verminephrobacter eiseniae]